MEGGGEKGAVNVLLAAGVWKGGMKKVMTLRMLYALL
jgi:hypothetical protein